MDPRWADEGWGVLGRAEGVSTSLISQWLTHHSVSVVAHSLSLWCHWPKVVITGSSMPYPSVTSVNFNLLPGMDPSSQLYQIGMFEKCVIL